MSLRGVLAVSPSQSLPWDEKYRPRRFADVIGQAPAIEQLTTAIRSRAGYSVVVSGPSGSGKTTLASIFAKAAMCFELTDTGDACGHCRSCVLWSSGWNRNAHEINCGIDGSIERIRELVSGPLDDPPMYGRVHAVVLTEAQGISLRARDALLDPIEKMAADCAFIFTLIDPMEFDAALRSRCRVVRLEAPSIIHRQRFLERICTRENVAAEPDALNLLARHTTNLRALAKQLQALAEAGLGSISTSSVREMLNGQGPAAVLGYLHAAALGRWDAQLQALRAAPFTAGEKVQMIREMLLTLKLRHIGPVTQFETELPFDGLLDHDTCRELVHTLEARAELLGLPLLVLFDQILDFWSFWPTEISPVELETQAVRFHDRLTLGQEMVTADLSALSRMPQKLASPGPTKRRARRPNQWALGEPTTNYLTVAQSKAIYEAASFLMQRYGVTFNGLIELDAGWFDGSEGAWGDFCSDLCRRLGQHYKKWTGDAFHRFLLHEKPDDAGLKSVIIFHAAPDVQDRLRRQVFRLLPAEARHIHTDGGDWLRLGQSRKEAGRVALHWNLVRQLWRGVDPDARYLGKPLTEILGVPRGERRAAGAIANRRTAASQTLTTSARAEAAAEGRAVYFAWEEQAWDALFTGWELREYAESERRVQAHASFHKNVDRDIANADDSLTRQNLISLRTREDQRYRNHNKISTMPWRR